MRTDLLVDIGRPAGNWLGRVARLSVPASSLLVIVGLPGLDAVDQAGESVRRHGGRIHGPAAGCWARVASLAMSALDPHPLRRVLDEAARGRFPPVDGEVEVLATDHPGTAAIVSFTGHSFVLCDREPSDPVFDGIDGFGGAMHPAFVLELAGPDVAIGSLDAVLVRIGGAAAAPLPGTDRYDAHPRVERARLHRSDVRVVGDDRGLVTIGSGLVGRTELSVEVVGAESDAGAGRALIMGALATMAPDEVVYAQVAPGNAASLRGFLACGFVPIGSEILIGRDAECQAPRVTSVP